MWLYLDDILNQIRKFLSIIIIWLSMSRDGHTALKSYIMANNLNLRDCVAKCYVALSLSYIDSQLRREVKALAQVT